LCDVIQIFNFSVFIKEERKKEKKWEKKKKIAKKTAGNHQKKGKGRQTPPPPTSGCACAHPRKNLQGHVTSGRPIGHAHW
jgi:hypothetical protein